MTTVQEQEQPARERAADERRVRQPAWARFLVGYFRRRDAQRVSHVTLTAKGQQLAAALQCGGTRR